MVLALASVAVEFWSQSESIETSATQMVAENWTFGDLSVGDVAQRTSKFTGPRGLNRPREHAHIRGIKTKEVHRW